MGLERFHVQVELALVVDGAASEEPPVANLRLERGRGPEIERLRRLHVVVTVDQDGGSIFARAAILAEYDGVPGGLLDLDIEPRVPHALGQPFGGPAGVGIVLGAGAHAGDAEEFEELLAEAREIPVYEGVAVVHLGLRCSHGGLEWPFSVDRPIAR